MYKAGLDRTRLTGKYMTQARFFLLLAMRTAATSQAVKA